jgi:hypothetical protein
MLHVTPEKPPRIVRKIAREEVALATKKRGGRTPSALFENGWLLEQDSNLRPID